MWDEEVLPRALQNHLLQAKHLTTDAELCMPQYLYRRTLIKSLYVLCRLL